MSKPSTPDEVLKAIAKVNPICHPQCDISRKEALQFATTIGPRARIQLCIGPSGSGKTVLSEWLMRTAFGKPELWPSGTKPIVAKTLRTTSNGYFSSKWMCRSLLDAVHDPFRALPLVINDWNLEEPTKSRLQSSVAGLSRLRDREDEYQDAFISLAKTFQIQTLLLDEANLMALTERNRDSTDYLEIVRGIIMEANCNAILFGTGDLVEALDYSAQMNRRETIITPGRILTAESVWRDFVEMLEADLGLEPGVLVKRRKVLHELSYGLPGELVELILRGANYAKAVGDEEVGWAHIEAKISTRAMIERMRAEADWIELSLEVYKSGGTKKPRRPSEAENVTRTRPDRKQKREARRYPVAVGK